MAKNSNGIEKPDEDLSAITIRIRHDQRNRLEIEQRARGTNLANVVRDNLDLAFAIKEELSNIAEGQYDENDPAKTPKLVHSLLFKVEERILSGLDSLAERFEKRFSEGYSGSGNGNEEEESGDADSTSAAVNCFLSLVTDRADYPPEVWIGAFLEVIPRIDLVSMEQLTELSHKGQLWLEENGYYVNQERSEEASVQESEKLAS